MRKVGIIMFATIAKRQLNLLEHEVSYIIGKCDSVIEFCMTPFCYDDIPISDLENSELKKVIARCNEIVDKLKEISNLADENICPD